METILSSSSAPSWRLHSLQGSRKFLHTQVRKDLPSVSTRPPAPTEGCQNTKTGGFTICQQPPKLIIIFAGMGCMLFIIIIAIVLLLYSFRRHRCQRPENSHQDPADDPTCCSGDQRIHEGTGDCGDVVLVQLPGNDIPQFFARPSPFTAMSESQGVIIHEGDKTLDVSDCSGDSEPTHNPNSIVHQPVATNNDGTHRNFLLPGLYEA